MRLPIIFMLLMLAGSLNAFAETAVGALSNNASKQAVQATDTDTVRIHLFQQSIAWFGQLESRHAVQVVSRVAGRIKSLKVSDETKVHRGEILFELAGKAVESRITDLKQQRHQVDHELEIAKKNLQLMHRKKQQRLATNEQVNAAKNILAQVKAHISRLRQNLVSLVSGIRISAPIDGVFTARNVQVGQYIQAGSQLARIVDIHHLRIRATLFPPGNVTNLVGQSAVIHGSHVDIAGAVSAVMPETTAEGGIQVWITWPRTNAVLKQTPGTQLSGAILLPHKAVAVPPSAIARDDAGHAFVFVRDTNKWRKQQVRIGLRDQTRVEIRTGLHAGEAVAITGVYEMLYRDFSSTYHAPD